MRKTVSVKGVAIDLVDIQIIGVVLLQFCNQFRYGLLIYFCSTYGLMIYLCCSYVLVSISDLPEHWFILVHSFTLQLTSFYLCSFTTSPSLSHTWTSHSLRRWSQTKITKGLFCKTKQFTYSKEIFNKIGTGLMRVIRSYKYWI